MTNQDALKSVVAGYPLSDSVFEKILIDRGVSATTDYPGVSKDFELATADVYKVLVTAANISEGGFQVSINDKSNYLKLANSIYSKYGLPTIGTPTVKFVSPW